MGMRSAMAAARANAIHRNIVAAAKDVAAALSADPSSRPRVSTRVAKYLLLNHPRIVSGYAKVEYSTLAKSIGAGVYEVYLKET